MSGMTSIMSDPSKSFRSANITDMASSDPRSAKGREVELLVRWTIHYLIISQSFPGFTDPLPVPPSFWWSTETIFSCLLHLNIQGLLEPHCIFLRCPTHAGEMVAVTGSSSILGSWQKDKVILGGLPVPT